jgi:dolichyl-phosphate-mannose-protein mannosyltransferase
MTSAFAFALIFFLIGIESPKGQNFDEFHYVPSAKQFLELRENQNWEHPPLGKQLMAIGIGLVGDRPMGWRMMSAIFGALTWIGMMTLGLTVFRTTRAALWVGLLVMVNHLLFVQARIGMLDTFMMAFLVWGLAAWIEAFSGSSHLRERSRALYLGGASWGFAIACKWAALIPWASWFVLLAVISLFLAWDMRFHRSPAHRLEQDSDFWESFRANTFSAKELALGMFLIPLTTYAVTFLPFLAIERSPAYTLWDLLLMQPKMWDGQLRVVTEHPYQSTWWSWPWLLRPIWYAFEKSQEDPGGVRGVLLIGNPWLMWSGMGALAFCVYAWIRDRSRQAFWALGLYAALYFQWIIIPRKVSFYYYYYPAGTMLALAAVYTLKRIRLPRPWQRLPHEALLWAYCAIAVLVFVYFYPVLSGMRIPAETFTRWTWFRSWI